ARREAELRAAYPVGTRVWLRGDPTPRTVTGYTDSPGLPPSLRLSGHTIARPRHVTRNPPTRPRHTTPFFPPDGPPAAPTPTEPHHARVRSAVAAAPPPDAPAAPLGARRPARDRAARLDIHPPGAAPAAPRGPPRRSPAVGAGPAAAVPRPARPAPA